MSAWIVPAGEYRGFADPMLLSGVVGTAKMVAPW
jgi:hypothetical protein